MRPFPQARRAESASAEAIRLELARRDIYPARRDEIVEARNLAANRIGPQIVSSEALGMVQSRSGAALFVTRSPSGLTGVLALIPLSLAGLDTILTHQFDGLDPRPEQVAAAGEEPAAIYIWGVAAVRKMAGAWLSNGLLALFDEATPRLAYFARPATAEGEHLLLKVGFRPLPGSTIGQLRRAPAIERRAAA